MPNKPGLGELFASSAQRLKTYSHRYSDVERGWQQRGTRFGEVTHNQKKKKVVGILNQFFNQDVNKNAETRIPNADGSGVFSSFVIQVSAFIGYCLEAYRCAKLPTRSESTINPATPLIPNGSPMAPG